MTVQQPAVSRPPFMPYANGTIPPTQTVHPLISSPFSNAAPSLFSNPTDFYTGHQDSEHQILQLINQQGIGNQPTEQQMLQFINQLGNGNQQQQEQQILNGVTALGQFPPAPVQVAQGPNPNQGEQDILNRVSGLGQLPPVQPGAPQPGGPQAGQQASPPPPSSQQIRRPLNQMITALGLQERTDAQGRRHYVRVVGGQEQPGRWYEQLDGTFYVEGLPTNEQGALPGETINRVVTGVRDGQPVFARGRNTPSPYTMLISALGLKLDGTTNNWTLTKPGENNTRYYIQQDGTILRELTNPGAAPTYTTHRLGANNQAEAIAGRTSPLPFTLAFADLGICPIRRADGSYQRPGDSGRYYINISQPQGQPPQLSIFYTGRTLANGGQVQPCTFRVGANGHIETENVGGRAIPRRFNIGGQMPDSVNNIAALGLFLNDQNQLVNPYSYSENPGQAGHNGTFTVLADGTLRFNGGRIRGVNSAPRTFNASQARRDRQANRPGDYMTTGTDFGWRRPQQPAPQPAPPNQPGGAALPQAPGAPQVATLAPIVMPTPPPPGASDSQNEQFALASVQALMPVITGAPPANPNPLNPTSTTTPPAPGSMNIGQIVGPT